MSLVTPDFGLLFWMTLIFAIVFFVLAKWGFPAITGMVDKRSERINESIEKAREAEKMLSEMAERQAAMLEETRAEQGRILREAAQA
ncbi:MAG: F0F1 ATP synthase subunit B, partial [Bacteroidales bacterium]|nr:F0F1 ATP synthase subunit B [Bacteroidales bacterium]